MAFSDDDDNDDDDFDFDSSGSDSDTGKGKSKTNQSNNKKKRAVETKKRSSTATTTKQPTAKKVSLPSNVPVSFTPPNNITAALTPGSHLADCNGSDIHLARGAARIPSSHVIAPPPKQVGKGGKTKHRYLIVWPGVLSLHKNRRVNNSTTTSGSNGNSNDEEEGEEEKKTEDNDKEKQENGGDNDDNDDDDDDKSEDENPTTTNATTSVVTTSGGSKETTLGTLQGLDTEAPTLTIPFGDDNDTSYMTFAGRKIQSSSKFMMLSCNKKGTVKWKVRTNERKKWQCHACTVLDVCRVVAGDETLSIDLWRDDLTIFTMRLYYHYHSSFRSTDRTFSPLSLSLEMRPFTGHPYPNPSSVLLNKKTKQQPR